MFKKLEQQELIRSKAGAWIYDRMQDAKIKGILDEVRIFKKAYLVLCNVNETWKLKLKYYISVFKRDNISFTDSRRIW